MSDKFKNKYRSDTVRLQNWDYGSDASYFITVCIIDRIHFIGEIKNGKMELSELGNVANNFRCRKALSCGNLCVMRWYKGRCTFECRKFNAEFSWQGRFYEHIIRNHESYKRIKNYINSNPEKWTEDKLNVENKLQKPNEQN
jgi:putative transposase